LLLAAVRHYLGDGTANLRLEGNTIDTMTQLHFITSMTLRQWVAAGDVCRLAPLSEADGRIAPISVTGGGGAP
jgi:hypothetical protein